MSNPHSPVMNPAILHKNASIVTGYMSYRGVTEKAGFALSDLLNNPAKQAVRDNHLWLEELEQAGCDRLLPVDVGCEGGWRDKSRTNRYCP